MVEFGRGMVCWVVLAVYRARSRFLRWWEIREDRVRRCRQWSGGNVFSIRSARWMGETGSDAEAPSSEVDGPVAAAEIVVQQLWRGRLVAGCV